MSDLNHCLCASVNLVLTSAAAFCRASGWTVRRRHLAVFEPEFDTNETVSVVLENLS